jgi:hypothetical protein
LIEFGDVRTIAGLTASFVALILWFGRLEWTGRRNREELSRIENDIESAGKSRKEHTTTELARIETIIREFKKDFKECRGELRASVKDVHERVDALREIINGKK